MRKGRGKMGPGGRKRQVSYKKEEQRWDKETRGEWGRGRGMTRDIL